MTDSLYIHIPFCISKCKYCDFFSIPCGKKQIPDDYITSLCNEIKYRLSEYKVSQLNTIYIGGGTPSLLSEEQIKAVFSAVSSNTLINPEAEITIEVNPDDVNKDFLNLLERNGINRVSCGIQSLKAEALQFCNRRADAITNIQALECFKKYWKKQLSLDLICGLPLEDEKSFVSGLQTIVSYEPDHISMYSLTIEDETPLGKMFNSGKLNYDFDKSDELWLKGFEILKLNDYVQYEVSNFCKKGHECRHNLRYWNHMDYIGCGSGGTGTLYGENGSGYRWTNNTNIEEYIQYWKNCDKENVIPQKLEEINIEDSEFEFFMMALRKRSGVSDKRFSECFNKNIPEKFISVFNKWAQKEYAEIITTQEDVIYRLNEKGIMYLNSFLQELL